jgi:uncharacterized membrane protein
MESFFSALFKYRPLLFAEGQIRFATPWPALVLAIAAGIIAVAAVVSYGRARGGATAGSRVLLGFLRAGALGVLLFALLQPTLVLTSTVPQRNFVGVVLDDSRSMGLPAEDGQPRSAFIQDHFDPATSELVSELEERFAVRFFRFASSSERVGGAAGLTFDGTRTDLVGALDRAREELASVPLSGLVVVTDGADNSGRSLAEALVPLQAASVPVFSVGLGEEVVSPDVQVGRISAPRSVLMGTSLLLDVVITHQGFGGRTLPIIVEDEERLLAETSIELEGAGQPTVTRVRFTLDQPGPRRIRLRVPVQDGERVTQNNQRDVVVEVREVREKILYFEGEPRFEVKFLRRAVADDANLQVVVLQRTAENKYLRLDVDDGEELAGGFPATREELFQYRGLILGSVEASFFTHDQLSMIADFVSERGGGFLMLGGRRSFAEGGYVGTPVAEALPVRLGEPAQDPRMAFAEVKVRPTVVGRSHVAAQIRADGEAASSAWDSLPPLSSTNRISGTKPGATTVLSGDGPEEERVVLAYHRYGRGKAAALPVQDSWMWQMHADVPLEDQTHETFWKQLLRWLVDGVPEYVSTRVESEHVEAAESVRVIAEVKDSAYVEVNDASVLATIAGPGASIRTVPLDWTVERDGEFAATFTPETTGDYEIAVTAVRGDADTLGVDRTFLRVGPSDEEYFDAGLQEGVLQRLAEETGGRYYRPAEIGSLPEDLRIRGGGVTLTEERDLWDMPVLFVLLVLLLGGEWFLRRRRGLV